MAATAKVIPLHRKEQQLVVAQEPALPEPAGLYCRVVIALFVHVPRQGCSLCSGCGDGWPCDYARQACMLIEGF